MRAESVLYTNSGFRMVTNTIAIITVYEDLKLVTQFETRKPY